MALTRDPSRVGIVMPGGIGGMERFAEELCTALEGEFTVEAVTPDIRPAPRSLARVGLGKSWEARQLRTAPDRHDLDVVVTNGYLGWPTNVPRVHVYHGSMLKHALSQRGQTPLRPLLIEQAVAGGAAEFLAGRNAYKVAVSDSSARELLRVGSRVNRVIPNTAPSSYEKHQRDSRAHTRKALFVGRLEPRKRPDLAVSASERAGWTLSVAGPERADDRTDWLGLLNKEDLMNEYLAHDVVLQPSSYEACSYVVLEALTLGVPILSARTGYMETLTQQIEGIERLIVEPGLDAWTAALTRVDAEYDRYLEVAHRARTWLANNGGFDRFSQRYREVIRTVLGARHG